MTMTNPRPRWWIRYSKECGRKERRSATDQDRRDLISDRRTRVTPTSFEHLRDRSGSRSVDHGRPPMPTPTMSATAMAAADPVSISQKNGNTHAASKVAPGNYRLRWVRSTSPSSAFAAATAATSAFADRSRKTGASPTRRPYEGHDRKEQATAPRTAPPVPGQKRPVRHRCRFCQEGADAQNGAARHTHMDEGAGPPALTSPCALGDCPPAARP